MKKIIKKIISKFREVRGKKLYELKILGLQIFLVTKTNPYHTNIFILFIPLLRIENEETKFALNILLFVWIFKTIKLLFKKWNIRKTNEKCDILFCNKIIFSLETIAPFNFPTALYKG